MKTVSIGYIRDDDEFRILATLNNIDDELSTDLFADAIRAVRDLLQTRLHTDDGTAPTLIVLERQDTPDYVVLDDEVRRRTGVARSAQDGTASRR